MNKSLSMAALSLGAIQFAGAAHAATAFIDGNIYWGTRTQATAYSVAGEIASFSFDVESPALGSTVSASNFTYKLNNSIVNEALSSVEFYPASLLGGFDLNFADGNAVTIYSETDIGSSGTIGPSGYYAATAAINDALPATGVGGVAVAVSSVPLPAALPLLGSAVLGLGVLSSRRKKVAA